MKSGAALFLRLIILLVVVIVFAGMIKFPQTEGRAAGLDLISIYKDPFIIYLYIASLPFFIGLYQAFKLLGQNKFSQASMKALHNIRYCAIAFIGFILGGISFVFLSANGEDTAGFVALCIYTTVATSIIAGISLYLEKNLVKHKEVKAKIG